MPSLVLTRETGAVDKAVALLKSGECVAIPTETVYGLAGDATNDAAIAKIFAAKGRPAHNPLIVHVRDYNAAQELIVMNSVAQQLAQHFWPGPLTIIAAQRHPSPIAKNVSGGLPSLAVRVPNHAVFQDILARIDFPLAAPSANASGTLSPSSPQIVAATLGDKIPLIIADGLTQRGLESSVIDCREEVPILLRHGALSIEEIKTIAPHLYVPDNLTQDSAPLSPGQMLRHYAPTTPLRLNAVDVAASEALLAFGNLKFMGIKEGGFAKNLAPQRLKNLSEIGDLDEAARNLFAHLFALDQTGASAIAVMPIPAIGIGRTINDRLTRACQAQEAL